MDVNGVVLCVAAPLCTSSSFKYFCFSFYSSLEWSVSLMSVSLYHYTSHTEYIKLKMVAMISKILSTLCWPLCSHACCPLMMCSLLQSSSPPQQQWVSQQPSSPRRCRRLWQVIWCTRAPTQWCTPPHQVWLMGGSLCSTPSPREPQPCRCPMRRPKTQVDSMCPVTWVADLFPIKGRDSRVCSLKTSFFQVLSLRCSSQHLLARCRSQSQRCSYTQYGKICILQVKLSYSLCNQHATWSQ